MLFRRFVLFAALPAALHAQTDLPRRFEIDGAHSSIGFAVRFMGLSTVRGAFSRYVGTVMLYPDRLERSTVSIIIAANSINTNHGDRDRHLKSPDFLDAEKYPYLTFRSTSIKPAAQGFVAEGDLALHGVTRRMAIPFTMVHLPTFDAWQNTRVTFQGAFRVSRKDFGIRGTAFWNSEFDPGRFAVSDDVDVELLVSATVPNPLRFAHPVGDSILGVIEARGMPAVLADYRAARASNPRLDSLPDFAFSMVAEKLIAKDRVPEAISLYEALIETRRSPLLRAQLGEAYLKAGKRERAVAMFEAAKVDSLNTGVAEWLRILRPK